MTASSSEDRIVIRTFWSRTIVSFMWVFPAFVAIVMMVGADASVAPALAPLLVVASVAAVVRARRIEVVVTPSGITGRNFLRSYAVAAPEIAAIEVVHYLDALAVGAGAGLRSVGLRRHAGGRPLPIAATTSPTKKEAARIAEVITQFGTQNGIPVTVSEQLLRRE